MGELKYDSGGSWQAPTPADIAEVDQKTAKYKELTDKLLHLHELTAQAVLAHQTQDPQGPSEEVAQLQRELFVILDQAFMSNEDEPEEVFSFVMFLINVVHQLLERHAVIANGLAGMSFYINNINKALGLPGTQNEPSER